MLVHYLLFGVLVISICIIEIVGTVNHPNMNLNDEEFAENKKALYLLKSLTEVGVKRKSEEWPPACFGLLHQPKRPKKK